jgi:hypothetical protein
MYRATFAVASGLAFSESDKLEDVRHRAIFKTNAEWRGVLRPQFGNGDGNEK